MMIVRSRSHPLKEEEKSCSIDCPAFIMNERLFENEYHSGANQIRKDHKNMYANADACGNQGSH